MKNEKNLHGLVEGSVEGGARFVSRGTLVVDIPLIISNDDQNSARVPDNVLNIDLQWVLQIKELQIRELQIRKFSLV